MSRAEIALTDTHIHKLRRDIETIHQIAEGLGKDDPRSYIAMYTANQMVNSIIAGNNRYP